MPTEISQLRIKFFLCWAVEPEICRGVYNNLNFVELWLSENMLPFEICNIRIKTQLCCLRLAYCCR